jgi:hypothetical protein
MPRKVKFNSAWQAGARKTAKNKNRGGGGKFTKVHATACDQDVSASHIQKTVVGKGHTCANVFVGKKPTQKVMHLLTCKTMAEFAAMYDYDNTRCAVCGTVENCEFEETSNLIFCSACLQSAHPAEEWWGTDLETADAFEPEGAILQEDTTLTRQGVFDILMANGSLMKPAKRGKGMVSIGNPTGHFKAEALATRKYVHSQVMRDARRQSKARDLKIAATTIPMHRITSFMHTATSPMHTITSLPNQDSLDYILDEALADVDSELRASVSEMTHTTLVPVLDIRARLLAFAKDSLRTENSAAYLVAHSYLKFEEVLREGKSELQAGRFVATHFYVREKARRKNAATNEHNRQQWYRYRSRSIIMGYRYFAATGTLLPERRGRGKGLSRIHDPLVRLWCYELIGRLGKVWSARTFRDKISIKLCAEGMLKEGAKIGRDVASYYLRQLGMCLVCPKKGIYKDGHEREDTVIHRKKYASVLKGLSSREATYIGDRLEIALPHVQTDLPAIVRVYHDECYYISSEGAIQVWVMEGTDASYKKPRGEGVMASGFICRLPNLPVVHLPPSSLHRLPPLRSSCTLSS